MPTNHPNRTRSQSTGSEEFRRKQSGDQHEEALDMDESGGAPHRPQRVDRGNMQKSNTNDTSSE
jgi:hypothetical protein